MATIQEALQLAITHHVAGRLDTAEQVYRQIVQQLPQHPDAWHLLGVIAQQRGQLAQSLEWIDRAVALAEPVAAYHSNRGETLRRLGRSVEAEQALRRAIELDPQLTDAFNNLGLVLNGQRRETEAVEVLSRALMIRPDFPEALNNRGLARQALGQSAAAIADLREAIRLRPGYAEAHHNLATELHRLRQLPEAENEYRAALAIRPDYAEALSALALAVHEQARIDEAERLLRQAVAVNPRLAGAQANLGMVLVGQRKFTESQRCFQRAAELQPNQARHLAGLTMALAADDQLTAAKETVERALKLDANNLDAWQQMGNVSLALADVKSSIAAFQRCVELAPESAALHSSLIFTQLYAPDATPEGLAALAAEYDRRHVRPLLPVAPRWEVTRDPNRRLRIGFVSADLREHPVGFFMASVLEHLNREQFEAYCYVDHRRDDAWARRLRATVSTWREVDQRSDEELAEMIRADRVDILFDLAGHSVPNRLPVFARRPAPVQVSWLGHAGATGSSAIDFVLTYHWLISEAEERTIRERIIRIPSAYYCLTWNGELPAVAPPPSTASGQVTFGSFLNPAKLTTATADLWSRVLQQVPSSRLLLKFRGLHESALRDRLVRMFVERGIDSQRIELRGHTPLNEMLTEYHDVDIAFDTYPFAGGTTTMYALMMGVPVVTLPGPMTISRQSLAILKSLGFDELVADGPDDYVARTVQLARDPTRLAQLRPEIRQRFAMSSWGDPRRFMVGFQAALRQMWLEGYAA